MKKRVLKFAGVFFVILLICTFFSRSIYYFTLPKVAAESPFAVSFADRIVLTSGLPEYKEQYDIVFVPPIPVKIDEIYVEVGDTITAGDALLRFDTTELYERISDLERQKESAEVALIDFRNSFSERVISLREQLARDASAASAGRELEYLLSTGIYGGRTESQLANVLEAVEREIDGLNELATSGILYADEGGLIIEMPISEGKSFSGGTVFTCAQAEEGFHLVFTQGELYAVTEGQSCKVYCSVGGKEITLNGSVSEARTNMVVVESKNLDEYARRAQNFTAEIIVDKHDAPVTVPSSAMVSSRSVYVIVKESSVFGDTYKIELKEVTTGSTSENRVEILTGITDSDSIVTAWDRALSDGMAVDLASGYVK